MSTIKNHLYKTHDNMKQRCYNANNPVYKHYGGRGIKVCSRWLGKNGYKNFLKDMGERPEGMSLERVDNNADYSPSNCKWATKTAQSNNTRKVFLARGTYKDGNKTGWNARIRIGGKYVYLGYFKSENEAHEAYIKARNRKLEAI